MQMTIKTAVAGGATRRGIAKSLLGGAAALAGVGVAHAQPRLGTPPSSNPQPAAGETIKDVTLDIMMPILQQAGFTGVKIEQGSNNRGRIVATLNQTPIYFFINRNDTESVMMYFVADFGPQPNIDAKYINAWNAKYMLSALYRMGNDGNGNLCFRMGMPLLGGVSADYLNRNVALYPALFGLLLKFKPEATS
jgi:hypothetical protein